jgi:hypothetical protein
MNTFIYSIYDKVSKDYGHLFEAPNDETAYRMIACQGTYRGTRRISLGLLR